MTDQQTLDPPADLGEPPGEDKRRLSVWRILAVFLVVGIAIASVWYVIARQEAEANAPAPKNWFSPYVDVTATPRYAFEDVSRSGSTSAVLAFIVSSTDAPCEPSWGTAYSLDTAGSDMDLDRRVARMRQLGGDVTISFGGAANSELSIGCTDVTALTAAYSSVVERYSATAIDLDIEGSTASDAAVNARRASAIAALTSQQEAAGHPIKVWLTLPVGASGLTNEGLGVVTSMLAAKVPLAGVNAMTMDYGVPLAAGVSMADQGELALTALQQQLRTSYAAAGLSLTDEESWQMIGATPMIGQNDIPDEVFGLADAQQLLSFAQENQLARLSMWSANRDRPCGPNYPNTKVVSDACSGIEQLDGDFAAIFGKFAPAQADGTNGASSQTSAEASATDSAAASATDAAGSAAATTSAEPAGATEIVDDPATSPYAIWNQFEAYPKSSKVVWHRNVYEAKWYTTGDQPDVPVATSDQTPWTLVGPVLPGETPEPTPTLPAGTYPDWNPTEAYQAGSRVLHDGHGFVARYWTQGDVPGAIPQAPGQASPWQVLTTP